MMGNPITYYTKEELESEVDRLENMLVSNPIDSDSLEGLIEKLEEDLKEGRYVTEEEKVEKSQLTLTYTYNWETLMGRNTPAPIWDFEELYSEIQSMAPEMTNDGIELGTAVGLSESIAESKIPKVPMPEEDLIIDLDEEEEEIDLKE
jgi:hypothetical protein